MPALKPTKAGQKLNIMVTEKKAWLKTNESKTETEHNGDWKNAWYKANEWKAETEHNSDGNIAGIRKPNAGNAENEHNGDWNNAC